MKGILFLLAALVAYVDCQANPLKVTIDGKTGAYSISVHDAIWLTSGDTAFAAGGKTYISSDGSLKLVSTSEGKNTDQFGAWSSTSFVYKAGDHSIDASIKTYNSANIPAVIFKQTYVDGASGTSVKNKNKVIGKFPSFKLGGRTVDLGYVAFAGLMAGFTSMRQGKLTSTSHFDTGIEGGPLVLFDEASNVLIISSLSQFFAASSSIDENEHQINWGIMGDVDSVPKGYSVEFIVWYGNQGVNQAFKDWGTYMTTLYQKSNAKRDKDFTIQYLGYWTDNGAYYYYHTEQGKNYEETILDTVNHFNGLDLPFRYLQYDSWWYPKGKQGGAVTWDMMDTVFPHGFKSIYDKTKLPITCHNRYWEDNNTYAKYHGGKYNFIADAQSHLSVPDDQKFWDDLFNRTRAWGKFLMYEQDWLNVETEKNSILTSDLFAGQKWLTQMGKGAESVGDVTIQYCMAYSRHMLQSLEIPTVTQARVSGDYQPGNHQWSIGITSLFADALNVAPFKDTFITTVNETGNPYHRLEPRPVLQSVIATLSTGPVGPGDGIGFFNKELIMRCCDADGLILKPSKPATAIDDQIKRASFGAPYPGPDGELYSTYSEVSDFFFGIVLVAGINNDYSVTPSKAWPTIKFPSSVAFSYKTPKTILKFGANDPIKVGKQCTQPDFCLYHTSPQIKLDNGDTYAILGEVSKWVPVSSQRVKSIQKSSSDITIHLSVQAKEKVTIDLLQVEKGVVSSVVCDNSAKSTAAKNSVISVVKGTCTLA